jgi:hypothetical protein
MHAQDRGKDSMSPQIRRLAIGWGGVPEVVPRSRIEERAPGAPANSR